MLGKNNIIKFNTFDATATAEQVLSPYIAYNKSGKITGSIPNIGSDNQTLSINGSYTIPKGYHDGNGKITQSVPTKDSEIYIPTTSDQTIASGKYLSGIQTIKGDSNLVAKNIKSGVSIFGVNGNYNASINNASILEGVSQTAFTSISFTNNSIKTFTFEEKLSTLQKYLISPQTLFLGIWGDLDGGEYIYSFFSSPLKDTNLPSIWDYFSPGGYSYGNWSGNKTYNMYLYNDRGADFYNSYLKLTLISDSQIKVENKSNYTISELYFNVYSLDFKI